MEDVDGTAQPFYQTQPEEAPQSTPLYVVPEDQESIPMYVDVDAEDADDKGSWWTRVNWPLCKDITANAGEIAGITLISAGFAMKWLWVGVVVGGVLLVLFCIAWSLPDRSSP